MNDYNLKIRTKNFSLLIFKILDELPNTTSSKVISFQIAKSGTSVGANYRAACRARSDKEFVSKLNIVLEEADESQYWLELINEGVIMDNEKVITALKEAEELISIFVTILKNTKNRMNKK
jgi:four helix bundle protein